MERVKSFFRGDRILIPIILIALSVRILGLGTAPNFDEVTWAYAIKELLHNSVYFSRFIPHPPLAVLLYFISSSALGFSVQSLRLVPMIAGLFTVVVSYYFAKSLYGRRAAVFSAALMSVIFYPVWMSLFIDVDGNVLTLFSLLTVFAFHKFEGTRDNRWIMLTGIFLGLALLSKYPAVFLFPVLILYDIISNGFRNLRPIILISVIGVAVFMIFPAVSFLSGNPEMFTESLAWGSKNIGRADTADLFRAYSLSIGKLFVFLFQYGTPILLLIPLYFLKNRKRRDYLLISYVLVVLAFYTFFISGGPKARYITPAVPVLLILSSKVISDFVTKARKSGIVFGSVFALSLLMIVLLNSYGTGEAFNSQNPDVGLLIQNSMFWYSGFASSPFAIHIHSLVFVAAASLILFLLWLRSGQRFLIALVSLSLAFNFFVIAQSFYPTVGSDFTGTVQGMAEYQKTGGLECELTTEKAFMFYIEDLEFVNEDFTREDVEGCVLGVNIQGMLGSERFRDLLGGCEVIETFESNGFDFGYIYNC